MTYGKEETLIASNSNAGKKQVAARLRSYRDCTGDNETQLTEQSLLSAIKNHKADKSEAKHMDNLSHSFTKYVEVHRKAPKTDKRAQRSLHQCEAIQALGGEQAEGLGREGSRQEGGSARPRCEDLALRLLPLLAHTRLDPRTGHGGSRAGKARWESPEGAKLRSE